MLRIFLLDDHELVRRGVCDLISAESDMTVVGQSASAVDTLGLIAEVKPDVAVLDISLGDGNGIDVCREIVANHPEVACLMLTSVLDDRALIEAEAAGASGFALKSVGSGDLVESIRKVASGARLLDSMETRMARNRIRERGDGLISELTPQERKIFDLIGAGHSNRNVADELFLAEKTVKNYVSNVLSKLGLTRRTEVAALAARIEERESLWRT